VSEQGGMDCGRGEKRGKGKGGFFPTDRDEKKKDQQQQLIIITREREEGNQKVSPKQ